MFTELSSKANAVKKACVEDGLLILTCGTYDNVIRWIPPLDVTSEEIREAVAIFERALEMVPLNGGSAGI